MYLKKFKRVLVLFILCIIIEGIKQQVYAAPFYYYPDTYEVKINNIKKENIENIEVEYNVKAFSYYIDDTSNFEDYHNNEIQEKLTQKAIENIGLNINSEEWKKTENGEWIFDGTAHITRMVKCNISKPQYLNNAFSIVIYNINEFYGRDVCLKISLKNGDIIYSNSFRHAGKVVDERSTKNEYNDAKNIVKKIGYFEGEYNQEKNEVNVSFSSLNDKLIDKTDKSKNITVLIALFFIITLMILISKHIRK